MKKLVLFFIIAACSQSKCPPIDVRPAGEENGVPLWSLRTEVLPGESGVTIKDMELIESSGVCPNGAQDISINYEPLSNTNKNYKTIIFYCL